MNEIKTLDLNEMTMNEREIYEAGIIRGKNLKIDELLKINLPITKDGWICNKHGRYMLNYCIRCYYEDQTESEKKGIMKAIEVMEKYNDAQNDYILNSIIIDLEELINKGMSK